MGKRFAKMMAVTALAGGILMSGTVTSAATFKDVNSNHWAKKEINYLVEEHIMNGHSNGVFQPNKVITKAQAAIVFAKALNLKLNNTPDLKFKDVTKKYYAYPQIAAVVEAGIFSKGEKFKPNEPMTREAVAEAIVKAFKLEGTLDIQLKDVPKNSKYYDEITILVKNEIANVYQDGSFQPNKKVTRAEFTKYLARALNKEFLPTQYSIPMNSNPVVKLFNVLLKNPTEAQKLFVKSQKYDLTVSAQNIEELRIVELKEIARLNGQTEFSVKINVRLNDQYKGVLKEGENQLFFLIKRLGYMDYKILSVETTPHLKGDDSITFTNKKALSLFKESNNSYWVVIMGGEGNRNQTTFTQNGIEYRYMAESLNTMEKLTAFLGKTYTPEQVTKLIKNLGIITYNGKLAQPNADGGSLLNWDKATIKQTANSTTVKKYELKVPIGETKDIEVMKGELRFVEGIGWRVQILQSK